MKHDQLSNLYEQILVNESSKSDLTNAKNDTVGKLKKEDDVFGETPDLVAGPEKQKIAKGPSYKISTSSETAPQATSAKHIFKGKEAAESEEGEKAEETKGTRVTPKSENDEEEENEESHEDSDLTQENKPKKDKYKYSYNKQQESFNMNAFENLFKKTLMEEEIEDTVAPESSEDIDTDMEPSTDVEETEETEETEESDLISDLKSLQDQLASILSRLEGISDEESEEGSEDGSYDEEDFDSEFGDEESEESEDEMGVKESVDKPKLLGDKSKKLQGKDNKVSKVKPKGGKAHVGSFKNEPKPKMLSSKGTKSKGEVKSTVSKGDFIK